jgi:hypothetical protein
VIIMDQSGSAAARSLVTVRDLLVLIDDMAGPIPEAATCVTVTGRPPDGTDFVGSDEVRGGALGLAPPQRLTHRCRTTLADARMRPMHPAR